MYDLIDSDIFLFAQSLLSATIWLGLSHTHKPGRGTVAILKIWYRDIHTHVHTLAIYDTKLGTVNYEGPQMQ